jgi:hypothetical protein
MGGSQTSALSTLLGALVPVQLNPAAPLSQPSDAS